MTTFALNTPFGARLTVKAEQVGSSERELRGLVWRGELGTQTVTDVLRVNELQRRAYGLLDGLAGAVPRGGVLRWPTGI